MGAFSSSFLQKNMRVLLMPCYADWEITFGGYMFATVCENICKYWQYILLDKLEDKDETASAQYTWGIGLVFVFVRVGKDG